MAHSLLNYFQVYTSDPLWSEVNIGTDNGWVPSGIKPFTGRINVHPAAVCRHMALLGYNRLKSKDGSLIFHNANQQCTWYHCYFWQFGAIILWISTNAGILLIGPLGTNLSEIVIEIHTFSFKKMHLKMSSGKWRPFCLGLNVLRYISWQTGGPWGI